MFFYSSKFYNYSAEISSAISSSQNLLIIMKSSSYSNFAANTLQNTFNIQSSSTSPFATPLPKPLEKIVRKQMKPCEKFGLDPVKLQNQELLKHRSYRRLYNIVANDQTEANQVFRPNLIKELYFLLQIAPFIQSSLLDGFLSKIQDWYNSNDHKKIKLSKNLDGMIQNVLQEKKQNSKTLDKKSMIRPKTGNQWDTSLVSFLRPYTAKLRNNAISNHKDRQSQDRSYRRPQSSKFGASTTDNTNYCKQKSRIHRMSNQIDDFSTQNIDILMQNRDIKEEQSECDLMEEWERSEDFKKKYRTVHPQEQPTYQKLMNLIMDLKTNKNQVSKSSDKKRKIQSATLAKQAANARALAEKQLNVKKDDIQAPNQQIQCGKDIEDSCDDNAQQSIQIQPEQEVINLQRKSKNYLQDKRSKQGRKLYNPQNKNHMYQMLNGVKILRPFTVKQNHIISKLGQYSCLQQNKRIIETKLDEQCAQKYKQFIRNKNAIKRQITRKSQSKRYMENFRKVVKILPSHSKNKQNIAEYSTNGFNQTEQPRQTLEKVFDFTSIPGVQNQDQNIPIKSTYNVKDYFEPVKKQTVVASYRTIKKAIIQPQNQIQNQGSMTNPKRLLSQQKFDPLHRNNLQNYNREALAEIQRIKQKMNGKISVSTDALLKALYIDAPYPLAELVTNKKQQKFQIPDKRYLMILKEQKKKKKRKTKHTKLNKSTDKSRR